MRVHDVHALARDELCQPPDVLDDAEKLHLRLERQAAERVEPGLAGLLLEPPARNQPEEEAMAASFEPLAQLDHRVGAAGPPSVGHELQDDEARRFRHAADLAPSRAAPNTSA